VAGWFAGSDLQQHLELLFPLGLSPHGWQYLAHRHDFKQINGAAFVNHDMVAELVFENVRRVAFPHAPSRLQSFFAWESADEARSFRQGDQKIYRLEADRYLRVDQRWLSLGVQNISALLAAHRYWEGKGTNQPRWEVLLAPPVRILECVL
jgi:hypothetical protein